MLGHCRPPVELSGFQPIGSRIGWFHLLASDWSSSLDSEGKFVFMFARLSVSPSCLRRAHGGAAVGLNDKTELSSSRVDCISWRTGQCLGSVCSFSAWHGVHKQ